MTAMNEVPHTDMACAVARETGWDLDEFAADHAWSAVALGPVGQHRDSDALDRSNYDVVYRDLSERFGEAVDRVSFGHWAVGWVEEIASNASRADVQAAIGEWRDALADYPVADESHFSELEYDEALAHIEWCTPSHIERDGIDYELATREGWAMGWANEIFSWICEELSYCRADEIGDDDCTAAALALGLYVPELPLVLLANLPDAS